MNKRFKRFSKIFAMILTLTMIWSVSVSAKDIERKGEYKETKTLNSTISPRASYYGYSWHNAGESRTNRFTVSGTGARMGMTLVNVKSFCSFLAKKYVGFWQRVLEGEIPLF